MIVKPFAPSSWTLGLQALVRRLPSSHPQYITLQQELKNKEAGDFAEQYILKGLQKLPQLSDCHLFHDVILPTILPMQMDILIITASGIVLLEIKNIRGTASIKDYYMLVGDTITNKECRAFLMLECKHVTKRLLQKTLRTRCNSGKLTKYNLSSLLETPLNF